MYHKSLAKNLAGCILSALLLSSAGGCLIAQTAKAAAAPRLLQRSETKLLPVHGENYRFTSKEWYIGGRKNCPDMNTSIAGWELRSPSGELIDHRSYSMPAVRDDCLESTEDVLAKTFKTANHEGIVLDYGMLPSTPDYGGETKIFVLYRQGAKAAVKALGPWIQAVPGGSFDTVAPDPTDVHPFPGEAPGAHKQHDALIFKLWLHRITVRAALPVRWETAELAEPWRCIDGGGRDLGCDWKIVDSVPQKPETRSFVRLYESPDARLQVKHVVLEPTSKIELIEARIPLHLIRNGEDLNFGLNEAEIGNFDRLWLHVRIDGREGWIHSAEDFDALGLPDSD